MIGAMKIRLGNSKRNSSGKRSSGPIGSGCALWIVAAVGFGITALVFPKLPDYKKTLEHGEVVEGKVLRVEEVDNITVNGRHPKRIVFSYGDGGEATLMLAMGERAKKDQPLKVRVLGDRAYPEGIDLFAKPRWLNLALFAAAGLGSVMVAFGVLRLAAIGGLLFAGAKALAKDRSETPPPPPPSPPPPPA